MAVLLDELIKRSEALTPDEQLQLAVHLIQKARHRTDVHWRDLKGLMEAPALGEDAQSWVSRTRTEATEEREKQ